MVTVEIMEMSRLTATLTRESTKITTRVIARNTTTMEDIATTTTTRRDIATIITTKSLNQLSDSLHRHF